MIAGRLDVVGAEHVGQVLHLLAREAVDDAALARVLLDEAHDVLVDVLRFRPHLIVEVGTVERALELSCIDDAQVLLDVRAHLVGGRRRERDDGRHADLVDDRADAAVLRTEVVPPLRDAVSLVDRIERDLDRFQKLDIILFRERFRSHIEQLRQSALDIGLHLVDGSLVKRRVQIVSHTFMLVQVGDEVHLVLHQGDERRDDDGHAVHQQ